MNTKRTDLVINKITKQLPMDDNRLHKSFWRKFKGEVGDEEDFGELLKNIEMNKLGISDGIQIKIDEFIDIELA